eukprot:Gb_30706 [translate_table: standard]
MQIVDGALTTRSVDQLISSKTQELTSRIEELEVQAQRERTQSNNKISLLISEIAKLDTLPSEDESTTVMEVLVDIKTHVDLLRQKAKVLKKTPLAPLGKEAKLSQLKMNYAVLQLKCNILEGQLQSKEEIMENVAKRQLTQERQNISLIKEQIQKEIEDLLDEAPLSGLATLHTQLATKRMLLDEGYQELTKVVDPSQRKNKEIILRHQYEELISFKSKVFMKKETTFQRLVHLFTKRTRTEMILYQPPLITFPLLAGISIQGTSSTGAGSSEGQAPTIPFSPLKVPMLDSSKEEIAAPRIHEEEVGTTSMGHNPKAPASSSPSHEVLPGPSERESIPRSSRRTSLLKIFHKPTPVSSLNKNFNHVGTMAANPQGEAQAHAPLIVAPRRELIEATVLELIPLVQNEPSTSGTKSGQFEKEAPLTATRDTFASSSIPKALHSKRKNPPSLGGPSRARVKK